MPGFEDRGGYRPKIQEHPDGSIEIPDGGTVLCDELIRYTLNGHRYLYTPTLEWFKGLTTILRNLPMDEGLLKWVASQGGYDQYKANLADAARRGTRVHDGFGTLLRGGTVYRKHQSEEEYRHLMSVVAWAKDHKLDTRGIEEPIWDTERKIATCIDWRGLVDGEHVSLNVKTGKDIYEGNAIQSNEEAIIYNTRGKLDDLGLIKKHGILRTNTKHKSTYEMVLMEIDQQRHELFNHLLAIERFNDPDWTPVFPKELPPSLSIAPPAPGTKQAKPEVSNGLPGSPSR